MNNNNSYTQTNQLNPYSIRQPSPSRIQTNSDSNPSSLINQETQVDTYNYNPPLRRSEISKYMFHNKDIFGEIKVTTDKGEIIHLTEPYIETSSQDGQVCKSTNPFLFSKSIRFERVSDIVRNIDTPITVCDINKFINMEYKEGAYIVYQFASNQNIDGHAFLIICKDRELHIIDNNIANKNEISGLRHYAYNPGVDLMLKKEPLKLGDEICMPVHHSMPYNSNNITVKSLEYTQPKLIDLEDSGNCLLNAIGNGNLFKSVYLAIKEARPSLSVEIVFKKTTDMFLYLLHEKNTKYQNEDSESLLMELKKQPLFKDIISILTASVDNKTNLRNSIVIAENYIVKNLIRTNKHAELYNSGLLEYTTGKKRIGI